VAPFGAAATQQDKVGTGAVGAAQQGSSVALSADATDAIVGGPQDNSRVEAARVFHFQPSLLVTPATNIVTLGNPGGPFMMSDIAGRRHSSQNAPGAAGVHKGCCSLYPKDLSSESNRPIGIKPQR
jgi:hypothetical protein